MPVVVDPNAREVSIRRMPITPDFFRLPERGNRAHELWEEEFRRQQAQQMAVPRAMFNPRQQIQLSRLRELLQQDEELEIHSDPTSYTMYVRMRRGIYHAQMAISQEMFHQAPSGYERYIVEDLRRTIEKYIADTFRSETRTEIVRPPRSTKRQRDAAPRPRTRCLIIDMGDHSE